MAINRHSVLSTTPELEPLSVECYTQNTPSGGECYSSTRDALNSPNKGALTNITTVVQSGPGSNGNKNLYVK